MPKERNDSVARHVARVVRQLRAEQGWSQADLAEWLEMHPRTVWNLESGESAPQFATVIALGRVFNVSVEEFVP